MPVLLFFLLSRIWLRVAIIANIVTIRTGISGIVGVAFGVVDGLVCSGVLFLGASVWVGFGVVVWVVVWLGAFVGVAVGWAD